MKILKLELENINSLKGFWSIDFGDDAFKKGQFVIYGPTGSGKTSILDAITLALYGRTPRQQTITSSLNEVITRGTSSCLARVTYQCNNETYVSEWRQQRTRDSATGNLKDAQGLVYLQGEPDNPIFSGKVSAQKKDFAETNSRIIQLDYSQFCRSVLLAQGEFDKFLTSSESERVAILEKLNGSEKYRKIAEKAGEHWSNSRKEMLNAETIVNALKQNTLNDEQKQNIVIEQEALKKELNTLKIEQEKNTKLLNWYTTLNEYLDKWEKSKKKLEIAAKAKEDFKEDQERLTSAKRAKNCNEDAQKLYRLQEEQRAHEAYISRNSEELSNFEQIKRELETLKKNVEDEVCNAEQHIKESQELWKEIRILDVNIASSKESRQKAFEEVSSIQEDIAKLTERLESIKQAFEKNNKLFDDDETFLKAHTDDERISPILADLKRQIVNFRQDEKNVNSLAEKIKQKQETLRQSEKALEAKQDILRNINLYLESHEQDKNLASVIAGSEPIVKELMNAVQIQKTNVQNASDIEQEIIKEQHNLEKIEQDITSLLQQQQELFASDIIVLADMFRKQIKPGEGCPVCGSKEHPACQAVHSLENDPQELEQAANIAEKVRLLNSKLELANSQRNSTKNGLVELQTKVEAYRHAIESAKEQESSARNNLAIKWEKWGKAVTIETCQTTLTELQEIADQFDQHSKEHESVIAEIADANTNLATCKTELESLEQQKNTAAIQLQSQETTIVTIMERWLSNCRAQDFESMYNTLYNRSKSYENVKTRTEAIARELLTQKKDLEFAIQNLSERKETCETANRHLEETSKELINLQQQRTQKFGDKNVDNEEQSAQAHLDSGRARLKKALDDYTEADKKLTACKKSIEERQPLLDKCKTEMLVASESFHNALARNNFASESAYKNSILPDDILEQLEMQAKQISDDLIANNQSVTDAQNSYVNCKKLHENAEPEETIKQKQASATERSNTILNQIGMISGKLAENEKNEVKLSEAFAEFDKKKQIHERWKMLYEFFGDKDGKEFTRFVQGLTFDSIIKLANKQLSSISDRYKLVSDGNVMIKILDAEYGEERSTTNLSGGEKFLISLSLALGISDFASRNIKIDSLFLDEGFGTLDAEKLLMVLQCLSTQQKKGKMLGIISHMESVVLGIDQKIAIKPKGDGCSILEGHGITRG